MLFDLDSKRISIDQSKKYFSITGGVEEGAQHSLDLLEVTRSPKLLKDVCPDLPGVYWMNDKEGMPIYVGKAKNLKSRLSCYFRAKDYVTKEWRVIVQAKTVHWVTLPDEFCALLRELEIIESIQPRLNVSANPLRTRNTYLCLGKSEAPHFFLSKIPRAHCHASIGPLFASSWLRAAVKYLNDFYALQDCPKKTKFVYSNQLKVWEEPLRPLCIRSDVGLCLAPCAARCSLQEYQSRVAEALQFLSQKDIAPIAKLKARMEAEIGNMSFEDAAETHELIEKFEWLSAELEKLSSLTDVPAYFYISKSASPHIYLVAHGVVKTAAKMPESEEAWEAFVAGCGKMLSKEYPQTRATRASIRLVDRWLKRETVEKTVVKLQVDQTLALGFEAISKLVRKATAIQV